MPRELTDEQRKEVKQIFKLMDRNNDGKISSKEFIDALRVAGLNPGKDEEKEIMTTIDTNGDGCIDFREFTDLMKDYYFETNLENQRMKEAFAIVDTDKDGRISIDELKAVLLRPNSGITEADVLDLFNDIDTDHSGFIEYEEFVDSDFCKSIF